MRLNRLVHIIVFLFYIAVVHAQSLTVESFRLLENDLTANTYGTIQHDQNGEVAALIKVVTPETGFVFDGGMMGIVKTLQKTGEIWVYVPHSIQKITVSHQELGVLRDYYFPIPIAKACTYEMKIGYGVVRSTDNNTVAPVVFKVTPPESMIYIDNEEPFQLDANGTLTVSLNSGHHRYRVSAPSYVSEFGWIDVYSEKVTKQVSLVSAKSTLTINTASEAEIRIDSNLMGTGTWTGNLDPGTYVVELRKPYCESVSYEIEIGEQETKTLELAPPTPKHKPLVIISNPSESEVFIDNRRYGITPLFIDSIECGSHDLSIRLEGKQDTIVRIVVSDSIDNYYSATLYKDLTIVKRIDSYETERDVDHEYVDLGLSVKWATYNIGSRKTEELGYAFAWGEINDKKSYTWSNYNYSGSNDPDIKTLTLKDDIANNRWGGDWRLPTREEFEELLSKCSWKIAKVNGRKGYKVTSKVKGYKGRSIFLPFSGCIDGYSHYMIGESGYYWSSSRHDTNPRLAWYLFIDQNNNRLYSNDCYLGFFVRPVCP